MSDRYVHIRYSPDNQHNYSDWRIVSVGDVGDFTRRVREMRFGIGIEWTFEIMVTDNFRCDLLAASWMPEVTR